MRGIDRLGASMTPPINTGAAHFEAEEEGLPGGKRGEKCVAKNTKTSS
jgi:hypothetical protein